MHQLLCGGFLACSRDLLMTKAVTMDIGNGWNSFLSSSELFTTGGTQEQRLRDWVSGLRESFPAGW